MADSAPKVAAEELQEPPEAIDLKAQTLADLIKKSKHFIAFTGAGVSTSAGIPDFRGPEGAWTLRAQGRQRTGKTTSTLQAIPTPTHMALVELQNRGLLKYLVSQNCDGLHRKSGILPDRISELHGNSNLEYCRDCNVEYLRDFHAVATYEKTVFDHRTGRKCALCSGPLLDSIVNFGEDLPPTDLSRACENAKKADLCLAVGSSLTVTPANTIPETVGKRKAGKLVICNLQETPIDGLASLRVHCKGDELMERVMEKLGIEIPEFILRRRLIVELETGGDGRKKLSVRGIDVDGTPATFLQSVKIEHGRRPARVDPFVINFNDDLEDGEKIKIELEFMGHYGEPNLHIVQEYDSENATKTKWLLEYNPQSGEWNTESERRRNRGRGEIPTVIDLTLDDTF